MDEQDIVAAFTAVEGFPRAALLAAAEQRDQLAPRFIRLIEDYLELPVAERPEQTPIFFIFHLLGDWRERAAYRPLSRLLRLPDREISNILDANADDFVRWRMCDALVALVLTGAIDRQRAATFLRDGLANLAPDTTSYVWVGRLRRLSA